MRFRSDARWIWSGSERRPNHFVCFRRVFDMDYKVAAAALAITADARYELTVDGVWLGDGPARAWPEPWSFDTYDLRGILRPGRNVLAVLVQDIGVGTFQYICSRPGLLLQMEWADATGPHCLVSDAAWLYYDSYGHPWPVPRICCQQGWAEVFDSRRPPVADHCNWRDVQFDDCDWNHVVVGRGAGTAPHRRLEPRDIPMLTREPVPPARAVAYEAVSPAPYVWSLDLRPHYNRSDRSAGRFSAPMMVASYVRPEAAASVWLHLPQASGQWKLNGRAIRFGPAPPGMTGGLAAKVQLRNGWNELLARTPDLCHHLQVCLNVCTDTPLQFRARPVLADDSFPPWLVLGPFAAAGGTAAVAPFGNLVPAAAAPEATVARGEAIWRRGRLSAAERRAPYTRELYVDAVSAIDVAAETLSDRLRPDAALTVTNPDALLCESAEWTTVSVTGDADARILLDFGRELVGYLEFEVDASDGTILDFHCFEFIQRDGRINLPDGMNNTLRYICRRDVQRYRTFLRRGFRYCWVVARRCRRPLRLRFVRALESTYPVTGAGAFACSDAMLNRIWEISAATLRCCAEDTYTDCPTYEQTHWVGDARNEALIDLAISGDPRLSRHCWLQVARSLQRSPLVESHVPSAWQAILPACSLLWMRWAEEHHRFTGDDAFGREALPWLDRNVDGIVRHLDDRGLFRIRAWNMLDWAPMDTPGDGVVTHQNCLAVLGLEQAGVLAARLGRKDLARRWRRLAGRIREAVNAVLWCAEQQAYLDCVHADGRASRVFSQQTQTVALLSGVADGQRARRCLDLLRTPPPDFVRVGSPFMMFFSLEVLAAHGQAGALPAIIRNYWSPQVDAGATTTWETYHHEARRKTRSHCHAWSAAPAYFLPAEVLGVRPLDPGFRRVLVRPAPGGMAWAHGRVPTPRGCVECRWSTATGRFELSLQLPPATPAWLELPLDDGTVEVRAGNVRRLKAVAGRTRLSTRSAAVHVVVSAR